MTSDASSLKCPECHTLRRPDAGSCDECGLLFVGVQKSGRRKTDRRRAEDARFRECPACLSENDEHALKCRYCGEVLDARYRAIRARRIRSQINYASWVAYILGVVSLFIFKPVGFVAIGAGLILSIAYYAIRVEDPLDDESGDDREAEPAPAGLVDRIKRQLGFEEVTLRHPRYPGLRTVVMGTPLLIAAVGYLFNYSVIAAPTNDAVSSVAKMANIEISASYPKWFSQDELVLDFDPASVPDATALRRSLVELSKMMQDEKSKRVVVNWGDESFALSGKLFRRLGTDRDALSELPEALRPGPAKPATRVTIPVR